MKWYTFLDWCEFEKMLNSAFFVYIKHVPDTPRRGTLVEEAFSDFRHMWE